MTDSILDGPKSSRRGSRPLLLLLAFAMHNLEEAATIPAYLPVVQEQVGEFAPAAGTALDGLKPLAVWIALLGATLLGAAFVGWVWVGRPTWTRPYGPVLLAAVMGVNVLIPHFPAAIVLGGYAPGLVTAAYVNLPLAWIVCRKELEAGRISRRGLVASLVGAAVIVPISTITLMSIGRLMVGA